MNLQFFFQIFGSKSGQVFQELDQIKNFQSLTTNILCGLLAMSYSSQFLKKKTLKYYFRSKPRQNRIQSMFSGKFLILHLQAATNSKVMWCQRFLNRPHDTAYLSIHR